MLLNCGVEKTLESPLDCKEIQPVHPKGNQSWIFIGRTDAEAKAPILWPPDAKHQLTGKDPEAGKDWRWDEKGMTEDEMVGWHHWLGGHEFEQAPGDGEGQGRPGMLQSMGSQSQTWLSNWTTIQQSDSVIHMYMFFLIFFPIMVYHRISNRAPCAIQ